MEEALLHEQQKNGKILMQLVVMTNELNERDQQIALLKKKEEHYEQTLLERENLFKQVSKDAVIVAKMRYIFCFETER